VEGVDVIPSDHCAQDSPPAAPLSVTCPHLPINVSVFYGMYQAYVQCRILHNVYMEWKFVVGLLVVGQKTFFLYICSFFFACKILLCGALSIDAIYGSFFLLLSQLFAVIGLPISRFAEYGINFSGTFVFPACFLAWWINVDGLVMLTSREVTLSLSLPLSLPLSLFYFSSINWIEWDQRVHYLGRFPFFPYFCLFEGIN